MKKSRFTDSQIIAVLKQAQAGTPVPELCREHGISSATFYKWRSIHAALDSVGAGAAIEGGCWLDGSHSTRPANIASYFATTFGLLGTPGATAE